MNWWVQLVLDLGLRQEENKQPFLPMKLIILTKLDLINLNTVADCWYEIKSELKCHVMVFL